ncbi:MAG: type II toxin-antitoxin system HicA family toxin [Nitrospirae bacterium]|nr:MAG: type II toxin-antitoxin system HicA family toxin [Nitrospirota bacterium]
MPKVRPRPLKHRELLKKLKKFGIVEVETRAKGSERMLVLKSGFQGDKYRGPQIPIKCHGQGTEHSVKVINAVLRRFDIPSEKFWED